MRSPFNRQTVRQCLNGIGQSFRLSSSFNRQRSGRKALPLSCHSSRLNEVVRASGKAEKECPYPSRCFFPATICGRRWLDRKQPEPVRPHFMRNAPAGQVCCVCFMRVWGVVCVVRVCVVCACWMVYARASCVACVCCIICTIREGNFEFVTSYSSRKYT